MILVTGAAGFIGSNLVAALNARSEAPVIICDVVDHPEKEKNLAGCRIAEPLAPEDLVA